MKSADRQGTNAMPNVCSASFPHERFFSTSHRDLRSVGSRRLPPLHQRLPRAPQSALQAQDSREQDIQFACFDFLHRARIDLHHLGQLLLRNLPRHSLSAHIRTKPDKLRNFRGRRRHALLGRILFLRNTAQWGVIQPSLRGLI